MLQFMAAGCFNTGQVLAQTESLTSDAEPETPQRVALLSPFPLCLCDLRRMKRETFPFTACVSGFVCVKAEANVQAVFRGRILGLQRVHVQEQR